MTTLTADCAACGGTGYVNLRQWVPIVITYIGPSRPDNIATGYWSEYYVPCFCQQLTAAGEVKPHE